MKVAGSKLENLVVRAVLSLLFLISDADVGLGEKRGELGGERSWVSPSSRGVRSGKGRCG